MGKDFFKKRPSFTASARRLHNQGVEKHRFSKADSCHRIPYKNIKEHLVAYIVNQISFENFISFIDLLYANKDSKEKNIVISMLKNSKLDKNPKICRKILSILNSAAPNLRPGSPKTNRKIGAKLDLSIKDCQFTPQSKKILLQPPKGCKFSLSNNGKIRVSFFQKGNNIPCGQEITPKRLSPESYRLFKSAKSIRKLQPLPIQEIKSDANYSDNN